jgi:hypothetical protein
MSGTTKLDGGQHARRPVSDNNNVVHGVPREAQHAPSRLRGSVGSRVSKNLRGDPE